MHDSLTITCNFILMSLIELMDGVGWTYGWVMGPMIFIVLFYVIFFYPWHQSAPDYYILKIKIDI